MFGIGLAIRLFGAALVWLGDGHDSVFRKGLVASGLILSVGGIGVLKYLLYSGMLPVDSQAGLMAMRQYDYHAVVPEAHGLMKFLFEFEVMVRSRKK